MLSQPLDFPDFPDIPDHLKITSKQTKASENMNCKLQAIWGCTSHKRNKNIGKWRVENPKMLMKILATVEKLNSCCCCYCFCSCRCRCPGCCFCYYCLWGDRLIGMGQLASARSWSPSSSSFSSDDCLADRRLHV